ncbi:MAG: hypothetical protein R3246_04410, partial [Acidimicrobiia bacterium]|nr:hypothetical protein [Acidimicrobiia bacterium]
MKPDEIGRARVPSDVQIAADGRIVFVVTQMDVDEDRYDRNLWLSDESGLRRFTTGGSDSHPRWSPDGSSIAFLRKVDKAAQLAVIPASGGEARILTDLALGVEDFEWSPDGSTLAAVGVTWVDEWDGLSDEERSKKPRRLTSVPYKFDNLGWVHDRRRHIWLVPADGGEPRCLTPGDFDERYPAWSPDGKTIAVITDRSEGRGLEPGLDVIEIDVDSGEISTGIPRGNWALAAYGPDRRLHLLGDNSVEWPGVSTVWRRETDGSLTPLTRHLDRSSVSLAAGAAR